MKPLRYALEAVLLYVMFFVFRLMPVDAASAAGGCIGRTLGPCLATSRKALANMRAALPGRAEEDYRTYLRDMWDNLGRVIAEYPHLEFLSEQKTEIVNGHLLDAVPAGAPAILFGGHMANWEVAGLAPYLQKGFSFSPVYRAPNNPWADRLLNRCRSLNGHIATIPKSRTGVRPMMETLQHGGHLALLIDQKYNEGLAVPFFGRDAMTGSAFVQLAQKFDCPLIPVRFERLRGANLRYTVYPPLPTKGRDIEDVIREAHALLEGWISERPGQWLWLHRRWPDLHKSAHARHQSAPSPESPGTV